jgi:hypothetical protein
MQVFYFGEMTQALYAHMNNKTIKKKVFYFGFTFTYISLMDLCYYLEIFYYKYNEYIYYK